MTLKTLVYRKLWNIAINQVAANNLLSMTTRAKIYKAFNMEIGKSQIFAGQFFVNNNISIGNNSFINYNCFFENTLSNISIGDNCHIAMNVMFCGITHEVGTSHQRAGKHVGEDIVIGDGTWIGTNVTILPGVTIGPGCVIAAGSVVTKDCEANSMYAGVPARHKKYLN